MSTEDVFRLLNLRAAGGAVSAVKLSAFEKIDETDFLRNLRQLEKVGAERTAFAEAAEQFRGGNRYLAQIEGGDLNLRPLITWLRENARKPLSTIDFEDVAQRLGAGNVSSLVDSQPFRVTWERLAESLLADSVGKGARTRLRDEHVDALKLLLLLRRVRGDEESLPVDATLGSWLARSILVLPRFRRRRRPPEARPPRPPAPPQVRPTLLENLLRAREDLLRVASDPQSIHFEAPPTHPDVENERLERVERIVTDLRQEKGDERLAGIGLNAIRRNPNDVRQAAQQVRPKVAAAAAASFAKTTSATLTGLGLDAKHIDPFQALPLIDRAVAAASADAPLTEAKRMLSIGGAVIDVNLLKESIGETLPDMISAAPTCQFAAGVGDLLIVRQKLKAYELADFAHVENILSGELREREHRRLNLTEETTVAETETETDKERDLQSTERNELSSEAQKTVKSDFGLEAGLQVSGSYGPTVSFSSSLNVGYSTSTEETQKKAVAYSKEVTDRSAERTRERIRKETRRRILEQIEELNRHTINNSVAPHGHVRGIYRWLNKVYDAQVMNYGQRMMFEFMVPEPAAYFLYAMVENPQNNQDLVKPRPPQINPHHPLTPAAIDPVVAQSLIAEYQVLDAPTLPASSTVVSHFDGLDDTGVSKTLGRGTKIAIPKGYSTNTMRISGANAGIALDSFIVIVGGKLYTPLYDKLTAWMGLANTYSGEISISVYAASQQSYVLGIDFFCTLNEDGLRKWQQDTYDAIMRTYQAQLADYEEKLAALAIQKGIQILGRNPLENRRLEIDELKKLAIILLTSDTDPSLDAYLGKAEPTVDVDAACAAGLRIRFFENAFEWRNLTYVYYPYFWGRKARWLTSLHLTDPDPDFAAFLKAGAARVQVPVRPGFEEAIAYFCQTGVLWNGNNPPLIDDDLYVPIIEEITEALGAPDNAVPYPEGAQPWEVRVPTSLVLVQNLEEIPGIIDALTQQPVTILPPG